MDSEKLLNRIKKNNIFWAKFIFIFSLYFMLVGFIISGPKAALSGQLEILTSTALLTSDFMKIGTIGGGLFNAGLVTILALGLTIIVGGDIRGMTVFALMNIAGFSLWGINIYNFFAPVLGVFAYTTFMGEKLKTNINVALFSTGITPIVSYLTFSGDFSILVGIILGNLLGFIIGFVLTPVVKSTAKAHDGHILYNVALALGFISTIFYSFLYLLGFETVPASIFVEGINTKLAIFLYIGFIIMLLPKIILDRENLGEYKLLLKETGLASKDFLDQFNNWTILFNMGITGILSLTYIFLIKGNLNGATLGPLIAIVSYSSFALHIKNATPIVLGIILAAIVGRYDINSNAAIMAVFFGAGLCPIAGDYGFLAGIITGIMHLSVATRIGILHGSLLIYNNAFAAGLVSILVHPLFKELKEIINKRKNSN